jgi:hypothetical protein
MREALPRMAAALRDELSAAVGRFSIHSLHSFSFAGEPPIDVRSTQVGAAAPVPAGEAELLVSSIQRTFYERCYARIGGNRNAASADAGGADFVRALAAANSSRERWDKGWVVHQFGSNGQVFVRKGDRERVAVPGSFLSEAMVGMTPQIGASVSIRVPRESLEAQPGYYFAFGETLDELADQLSLVRFYFNCHADGAATLVGELSAALNRFQTPFQLKTPAAPALYERTDAAVLYVSARYFPIVARIVMQIRDEILLDADVPLFTKPLWPGIGVAMEPGSGESFGSHRCRLTAEAIVEAWKRGDNETSAQLAAVAERFGAAGLDLARPWLGSGAVDLFDIPTWTRLA